MATQNTTPGPDQDGEQEPYVPASPIKRIMAWTGVAYMVCLVFLNVYPFFRGNYLTGVAPLLVCPGAAGLFAIAVYQFRRLEARGGRLAMVLLAAACLAVFVLGLKDGIPALLAGLGGTA